MPILPPAHWRLSPGAAVGALAGAALLAVFAGSQAAAQPGMHITPDIGVPTLPAPAMPAPATPEMAPPPMEVPEEESGHKELQCDNVCMQECDVPGQCRAGEIPHQVCEPVCH
jgi:hypothetical protein